MLLVLAEQSFELPPPFTSLDFFIHVAEETLATVHVAFYSLGSGASLDAPKLSLVLLVLSSFNELFGD